MTRLLLAAFALLAPFALFWVYTRLDRAWPRERRWPFTLLWLTGAVLAIETFVVAALDRAPATAGRYVPAQLEDGRVAPARIEPEKQE